MPHVKTALREQYKDQVLSLDAAGLNTNQIANKLKIGTNIINDIFLFEKKKVVKEKTEKLKEREGTSEGISDAIAMYKAAQGTEIILTFEQEQKALDAWNNLNMTGVMEITQFVFDNKELDGRSKEARAIKKFLSTRDIKTKSTSDPYVRKEAIVLKDEQKEFIKTQAAAGMSVMEITKSLFNDPYLMPLSLEARVVREVFDEVVPQELKKEKSFKIKMPREYQEVDSEYRPPTSLESVIKRINAFVYDKMDPAKLNPRQKNNALALMHYLNVHRFQMVMNEFDDDRDRVLMESSFIRWLHDKGNLSEEEVDLYINWGLDMVQHAQLNREISQLKIVRDNLLDEDKMPPKGLVDQMNKLQESLDQNQKRQKIAQNDLSGKRRDRVDGANNTMNLLQLVDAFKESEKREKLLKLVEARKKDVGNEIDRLETMDELKAQIFGIDRSDILNGIF